MAPQEHIEAIEKWVWTAADTLRANTNYASNEYLLPVMGLVSSVTPTVATSTSRIGSRLSSNMVAPSGHAFGQVGVHMQ